MPPTKSLSVDDNDQADCGVGAFPSASLSSLSLSLQATASASSVAMATVMAAPTRPWSVWRDWGVIRGVVIYMALSWAWIISDEVFAVQALTSTENNGLGMTSANLGALGAVIGAVYMATQYKAYAAVDRRFGSVQVLQWSMLLMIPVMPLLSLAPTLAASNRTAMWAYTVALYAWRCAVGSTAFTASLIVISNRAPNKHAGRVNGFQTSAVALVRTVGPSMGGSLFGRPSACQEGVNGLLLRGSKWTCCAKVVMRIYRCTHPLSPSLPSFLPAWTEGNGLAFPLDHHLVWFVLGLAFTFGTVVAFRVPASDAYRRTEDGEEVRSGGRHTHMLEV